MLLNIIKKELLNNLLTARTVVCYVIIFVLIFFSVVLRAIDYQKEHHRFVQDKTAEVKEFADKMETEEKDNFMWDREVFIPPRPLSIFCTGFNQQIIKPFSTNVSQPAVFDELVYDNPILRVFKVYDTTFIIAFIVSLLAIFVTFDSFTGEREHHTLRLVLSNQLSRSTFILGKFIGSYISLIWPVLFSLLFSLAFLLTVMGISFYGTDFARFLVMTASIMGYLAIWFLISMVVSIVCRQSSFALLVTVALWIVFCFGMLFGAAETGKRLTPVRLLSDLKEKTHLITKEETGIRNKTVRKYRQEKHPQFRKKQWETYYTYFMNIWRRTRQEIKEENNKIKNQMFTSMRLARVSPVASFLHTFSNIAGTGMLDLWHAEEWKDWFYMEHKMSFENDRAERQKLYRDLSLEEMMKKIDKREHGFDPKTLPAPIYHGIALSSGLAHSVGDILVMLLESLVLFMAGFYLFIRKKEL